MMFPKPVRAPKERHPLKRGKPMRRTWMRPSARGTKHSRRERNFDRMGRLAALEKCAVKEWLSSLPHSYLRLILALDFSGCLGRLEVAHLSLGKTAGRRRAPDSQTAPLCHLHHVSIDGTVGGKAPWYVALGYDGQQELRRWLIDWADAQLAAHPASPVSP